MGDYTEGFRRAILRAGLDFSGPIIADGKLHRFKAEGDHARNSWYVLHSDPPAAGAFGCWKRGINETWCPRNGDLSQVEWKDVQRHWRDAEQERDRSEKERQSKARKVATRIFARATALTTHAYLAQKGVKALGDIREYHGALLVPLRDINGELHSLQFIGADGAKRFLSSGRIAGCFFAQAQAGEAKGVSVPLQITVKMEAALRACGFSPAAINKMKPAEARAILNGPLKDADTLDGPLVLCEGYATGASVHEATGFTVVCAMNCGNLLPAAQAIRAKWPTRAISIAADNDAWTAGNPGLTKATEAAKAIGAKFAVPQFADVSTKPKDFNDLHRLAGLDEVKRQIEAATEPPNEESDEDTYCRLAKLSIADYDRCREDEAERLGIRVPSLDVEVYARRAKKPDNGPKGNAVVFPEVKLWDDPVNGAELLDEILVTLQRYVGVARCAGGVCLVCVAHLCFRPGGYFADSVHHRTNQTLRKVPPARVACAVGQSRTRREFCVRRRHLPDN